MEELAEKLGFEFTLDLLGDDQVAGATRSANEARSVKSAAAVLKNHARSYMKQARKDGVTLLQRLGTDAHFAYNCSVQDLTPRCMHWVSVLGNSVLPSINRTREEIRTGRMRQFKVRICIVAWDTTIPNQQIVVHGRTGACVVPESLLQSEPILCHLRPVRPAGAVPMPVNGRRAIHFRGDHQPPGLPGLRRLRGQPDPDDNWGHFDARRKPSHPQGAPARSELQQVNSTWVWISSGILPRILPAGVERLLQPVVRLRMGGVASAQPGAAISR